MADIQSDNVHTSSCPENINDRFHLFTVQSQITYAVAMAVIRYYGIKPENCALCAFRGFKVPQDCPSGIAVHHLPEKYIWLLTYVGTQQKKAIRYIDDFATKATQDRPFEVYVAHTLALFFNLFISHKKCLHYNIIEEGCSRFCSRIFDPDDISCRTNRAKANYLKHPRFNTVNRCWLDTQHEKFGSMFAIYPDSYVAGKNVVVVPDVFQKIEPFPYKDADAFLVIDMVVQYRQQISIAAYIQALDYLISEYFIPLGYRKVYYKSRKFEEYEELGMGLQSLEQTYRSCIALESLPDDCFFENVVYSSDAPVYFVLSSVGFFAQTMGRETYTIADVCGSFDPELRNEFYMSERNVMTQKSGVIKLPCDDVFCNRSLSVKQSLADLRQLLKSS